MAPGVSTDDSLKALDVIEEISPRDDMFRGNLDHYFQVGRNAVRALSIALQAAGKREVSSVLDCPSGHGRVLRALKAAFPGANLTACDIDREAVEFCAETFGAAPVYAETRPEQIRFDREFDLIWSGSLFTHLEADRFEGFLRLFGSHLAPEGLLVFTTNGPGTQRMLRSLLEEERPETESDRIEREKAAIYFPVPPGSLAGMAAAYEREGFGYGDYDFMENFGATLCSPAWVCRQLERLPHLQLIGYTEQGWGVQDVVACRRRE